VLATAEVTSVARGRYVFHFEPGLRLRAAGWLRGVGTPDLTEHRVLRLLLGSLDVAPRTAERLVAESAGQVRQMLAYVFYQRERGQAVRSPGRYVIDGVAGGWTYDGHEDFQRWLRARQADARVAPRLVRGDGAAGPGVGVATPAVPAPAEASVPAVPDAPSVPLPPVDAEVAAWWGAASMAAAAALHPLARAYLERARPAVRSTVTLLVVAHTDGEAARLAREAHVLSAALAEASAGAVCEALVLSPQQWRARSADVEAPAAGG
jgi:hypothetical protein